jgi:ketosteroid isomerase-like protein
MAEHPNATVVRNVLDAMNRNDAAAINALLDDQIEWHEIGMAQPIIGLQALNERYAGPNPPDYQISSTIHDVVANDEHAVALVQAEADRGGRHLSYRTAEILHVRDGKITARWAFSDDTQRINEFFA